jgi:mRNA interferase RelE/StbE
LPHYSVSIEAKAQKQLRKIPKIDQERIIDILNILEKEGLSARIDIKKLRGYQKYYRIRLGNYRILFELTSDQIIVVFSISQRENAYK